MEESLERFREAHRRQYQLALTEIKNGKKIRHWIWYIFPQMKGLGKSYNSSYYGIKDLEEAKAYLADPMLGGHLREICGALLELETDNIRDVMDPPDDKKVKSSMTLFDAAADAEELFQKVLEKYYRGQKDTRTLKMLGIRA